MNLAMLFHYRPYCHLAPTYCKFYMYHLLKWRYLKFILVYTLARYKLLIFVLLYYSGPRSNQSQCTDDGIGSWKAICFAISGFVWRQVQLSQPLLSQQYYFYLYHYEAVATFVELFKKRPHISYDNCNAPGMKWQS